MKITEAKLKQIINEEVTKILNELDIEASKAAKKAETLFVQWKNSTPGSAEKKRFWDELKINLEKSKALTDAATADVESAEAEMREKRKYAE